MFLAKLLGQVSGRHRREINAECPDVVVATPLYLHKMPVEIFLMISDELRDTPEAVMAFAVTCKALYRLLAPRAPLLDTRARDLLLILLEKDVSVGSHLYFCPICHKLHPFSASWGPESGEMRRFSSKTNRYSYVRPCYEFQNKDWEIDRFFLGYHHTRLVLNRHLYGAPHGLPLSNLENLSSITIPYPGFWYLWSRDYSAKIIDNELYLCITRRIRTGGMIWTMDSKALSRRPSTFLAALQGDRNMVCSHISKTIPPDHPASVTLPHEYGERVAYFRGDQRQLLSPCQDHLQSCNACLTDYYTTVEWVEADTRKKKLQKLMGLWTDGWIVTVVSYHRFGHCRSPLEWKWAAMAGWIVYPEGAELRNQVRYPPGSIRANWLAGSTSSSSSRTVGEPQPGTQTIQATTDDRLSTELCPIFKDLGKKHGAVSWAKRDLVWTVVDAGKDPQVKLRSEPKQDTTLAEV